MGKLFNQDSPLMRFLNMVTNLLWLNILTILCCIPIITAGASITAMHYVCLKLVRGNEGYITKDFFRSFKRNFKQATVIWLMVLVAAIILGFDFWYLVFSGVIDTPIWMIVLIGVAALFVINCVVMVFPVLSHFDNTIKGTLKNSLLIGILQLPKTALMILLWAVPPAIWIITPQIAPLAWFFWFSFPGYVGALLYSRTFLRFEPEQTEKSDMEWNVTIDGEEGSEDTGENPGSEKDEQEVENSVL